MSTWKEFCLCCSGSTGPSHGVESHASGAFSSPYEPPRDAVVIEPLPSVESLTAAHHRMTPTQQSNGAATIQQAAAAPATVPPPSGPAGETVTNAKSSGGRAQQPPSARQDWTAFHVPEQQPPPVSVPRATLQQSQNFPVPPKKNASGAAVMKNPPPPALHIDTSIVPEPISTTAKFEEWEQKSAKAQQVSVDELLSIPEDQRADLVYQYLTPEQIIDRKSQLAEIAKQNGLTQTEKNGAAEADHSHRPVPSPIEVDKTVSEEHPTAEDFVDHDRKRHSFFELTDQELVNMPLVHLESFYEHLTADEIIDATKKLESLKKAVKEGTLKGEKPKLARISTDFMRSLRPTVSLRSENGGFIDDEYVPDDVSAIDVRDILLQASDDEVMSLSEGVLQKLEPLLSINEMEDLRERRFLIEAARRAQALVDSDSYSTGTH